MSGTENTSHSELLEKGKAIEAILRSAVRKALLRHKQLGVPAAIGDGAGGVILLQPEDIDVEE